MSTLQVQHQNRQYPQRRVEVDWKESIDQNGTLILECGYCGREYDINAVIGFGEADSLRNEGCSADDCPSHWESQGYPHPEHTNVGYIHNSVIYEALFLSFWNGKAEDAPFLGESFYEIYIPQWNAIHQTIAPILPDRN